MAQVDKMTDSIRVRIEPEKKAALTRLYEARNTNISQEVRSFLDRELEATSDPLSRLDAIMESVDAKLEAYGAPEPTIQDIVAYVERVRVQRAKDAAAVV